MSQEYGEGVWFYSDATVSHKVFDYRTNPKWLLYRGFWQGYSKRAMKVHLPDSTGEEKVFLWRLIAKFVPARLKRLLLEPSRDRMLQLFALFILTGAVGIGYLYGYVRCRQR